MQHACPECSRKRVSVYAGNLLFLFFFPFSLPPFLSLVLLRARRASGAGHGLSGSTQAFTM